VTQIRASIRDRFNIAWDEVHESQEHKATKSVSVLSTRKIKMKNSLLMLLFLLGLSCQVFSQTPATGFEGSWQGTLEAGGQKLRLVVTVTKSDAGTYTGKLESSIRARLSRLTQSRSTVMPCVWRSSRQRLSSKVR
jgi:hypothetical protein